MLPACTVVGWLVGLALDHWLHKNWIYLVGLIAGIELVRDTATKESYAWEEKRGQRVCDFARAEGVLLRPLGNVVVPVRPEDAAILKAEHERPAISAAGTGQERGRARRDSRGEKERT